MKKKCRRENRDRVKREGRKRVSHVQCCTYFVSHEPRSVSIDVYLWITRVLCMYSKFWLSLADCKTEQFCVCVCVCIYVFTFLECAMSWLSCILFLSSFGQWICLSCIDPRVCTLVVEKTEITTVVGWFLSFYRSESIRFHFVSLFQSEVFVNFLIKKI